MVLSVLLADPDPGARAALAAALRREGLDVVGVEGGLEALQRRAEERVDVLVVAAAMPFVDGLETCRRLRAAGDDVPAIVLCDRDAVDARVSALEAGADDALSVPFVTRELVTRIHAVSRRNGAVSTNGRRTPPEVRSYADIHLDHGAHLAWRGERRLALTRTEFLLLDCFLEAPEQVLERSQLLLRVWGYDFGPASNTLGVYVGYVRRKLEAGGEPRLIHTVRAVGYVLRDDAAAAMPHGAGQRGASVMSQPVLRQV